MRKCDYFEINMKPTPNIPQHKREFSDITSFTCPGVR